MFTQARCAGVSTLFPIQVSPAMKPGLKTLEDRGAANNWAGMALDVKRGVVHEPTGSAVFDFYGADRVEKICSQIR